MGGPISQTDQITTVRMQKTLIVLAVLCMFALTEAAKFARLTKDEPVTYCSSVQLIACVGEIESAWDQCSSAGSVDEVLNCIQSILGASDCFDCVCDITGLC